MVSNPSVLIISLDIYKQLKYLTDIILKCYIKFTEINMNLI